MKRFNLKEKCSYYMSLAKKEHERGNEKLCKKYFIQAIKKMNQSIYQYKNSNKQIGDYVIPANPERTYDCCIKSGYYVDFSIPWWFKDKRSKNFLKDLDYKKNIGK